MDLNMTIHAIADVGLPPMPHEMTDADQAKHVAFVFDGAIVSGWPLPRELNPGLYLPHVIAQRAALATPEGLADEERERIIDACGRTTTLWQADPTVGSPKAFAGVTHWVEFHLPTGANVAASPPASPAPRRARLLPVEGTVTRAEALTD